MVVGVTDSPLTSDKVRVANGACGVGMWEVFGLHGGVGVVWEGHGSASAFGGGGVVVAVGVVVGAGMGSVWWAWVGRFSYDNSPEAVSGVAGLVGGQGG